MLKTPANPDGLPMEVLDKLRSGIMKDRSQFYMDLAIPFYGTNRPGAKASQAPPDLCCLWSMQAGTTKLNRLAENLLRWIAWQ